MGVVWEGLCGGIWGTFGRVCAEGGAQPLSAEPKATREARGARRRRAGCARWLRLAEGGGNGAPEVDPPGRVMTNFLSGNTVTEGLIENFVPGSISRVTVVIWLEGNDPECTDDILGGEFKMDMSFEIVDDTVE